VVALNLIASFQKFDAENFLRKIAVLPLIIADPIPTQALEKVY
jgi:hypothetical protein